MTAADDTTKTATEKLTESVAAVQQQGSPVTAGKPTKYRVYIDAQSVETIARMGDETMQDFPFPGGMLHRDLCYLGMFPAIDRDTAVGDALSAETSKGERLSYVQDAFAADLDLMFHVAADKYVGAVPVVTEVTRTRKIGNG